MMGRNSASAADAKQRGETLFIAVAALLIFLMTTASPVDNDTWWHLRAGNETWDTGRIPLKDAFSYTRSGAPWVNAFWLSDLGLYGLWNIGGFFAITVATALLAVAVMAILYAQMEGPVSLRGILLLIATAGATANWTPRPQLLSFLLLAILDYFLHRHIHIKRQPLWLLTVMFALWGNLHGGFIWGILLLLAVIVGETANNLFDNQPGLNWKEIRTLTLWSILAVLAVSFNPNGPALLRLPFQQVDVSLSIQEWLSPDFHRFYAHPLLWLFFLWIIGLSQSKNNTSYIDLLKGLGFAYLFFFAQRNLGPFAVIIAPLAARALTQGFGQNPIFTTNIADVFSSRSTSPIPKQTTTFINIIIIGLLGALAWFRAYSVSLPVQIDSKTPARAVQWVRDNQPRGPMFNSYNWGGYLTWSLREYPVFIDGRADLYGKEIIVEWHEIANGTDAGYAALDKRGINLIFLEPEWPVTKSLSAHGWRLAYQDDQIGIWVR